MLVLQKSPNQLWIIFQNWKFYLIVLKYASESLITLLMYKDIGHCIGLYTKIQIPSSFMVLFFSWKNIFLATFTMKKNVSVTDPKSHVTIRRLKEGPQRIINDLDNDAEIFTCSWFLSGSYRMGVAYRLVVIEVSQKMYLILDIWRWKETTNSCTA